MHEILTWKATRAVAHARVVRQTCDCGVVICVVDVACEAVVVGSGDVGDGDVGGADSFSDGVGVFFYQAAQAANLLETYRQNQFGQDKTCTQHAVWTE